MFKRTTLAAAAAVLLLTAALGGCTEKETPAASGSGAKNTSSGAASVPDRQTADPDAYEDEAYGFQLEAPAAGEEIAVMHTSLGDLSIRFFPAGAPNAVNNFKVHAQNGYYDGLTFHRIIPGFMIQGGDPDGTGRGGASIWGKKFDDEFNKKLMNLRGALAMANSGQNTNGSQFFVNQAPASAFSRAMYGHVPEDALETYEATGGNIHLDGAWRSDGGGHTVFGQVFEGLDVLDAIAAKGTSGGTPTETVTITSIDIVAYAP